MFKLFFINSKYLKIKYICQRNSLYFLILCNFIFVKKLFNSK